MTRSLAPILILVLIAATALTYADVCRHKFTYWDDDESLTENVYLNPPTASSVVHFWRHAHMSLYIPVTYTVWSALAAVAQSEQPETLGIALDPRVFHTANVLVHILATLACFALLRLLLGHDAAARPEAGAGVGAMAGAMLFALHPLQVESVAWASGMKDVLAGLFSLIAVWQYLVFVGDAGKAHHRRQHDDDGKRHDDGGKRHHDSAKTHDDGGKRHYAIGLAAFVFGFLSKPTAIVVPLLAALLDLVIMRRPWRSVARSLWPWFALMIPAAIVTKLVQPAAYVPGSSDWNRPLVAAFSLAFYIYKLVWPIDLAIDYGHSPPRLAHHWWFYVVWLIPMGLALLLWRGGKRHPLPAAGGLIFVIGLLPVLGLVTFVFQGFSTVGDHYMYLSMLGPALALGWIVAKTRRPVQRPPFHVANVAVAILLAAFAIRTTLQTFYWRDNFTLFRHTLDVNPTSWASHNNLAAALTKQGRFDEAIAELEAAVQVMESLPPDMNMSNGQPRYNLAVRLMNAGYEDRAVTHLMQLLKDHPDFPGAKQKLAEAEARRGQAPPASSPMPADPTLPGH